MHHSNTFPVWFSAATDAWFLGLEAAMVIGLRSFKLAQGGAAAQAETQRMISEKIAALFELHQLALAGKLGETNAGRRWQDRCALSSGCARQPAATGRLASKPFSK